MKHFWILFIIPLFLISLSAQAQFSGGGGKTSPAGTSGQTQYNNGGIFGAYTPSGDFTVNTSTGVVTLTATTNSTLTSLTGLTSITGPCTTATQTAGDNSNKIATTAYAWAQGALDNTNASFNIPFFKSTGILNYTDQLTVNAATGTLTVGTSAHQGNIILKNGAGGVTLTSGSGLSTFTFPVAASVSGQPLLAGTSWGFTVEGTTTTTATTLAISTTANRNERFDCTSNAITATLPDATTCATKRITLSKVDAVANAVTINTTSSQTIGGAASGALTLANQNASLTVVSNGTNWDIAQAVGLIFAIGTPANNNAYNILLQGAGAQIVTAPVTANGQNGVITIGNSGHTGGLTLAAGGANITQLAPYGGGGGTSTFSFPGNPAIVGQSLVAATGGTGTTGWSNTVDAVSSISTTQTLGTTSSRNILSTGTITITLTPAANKRWTIFNNDANTKTIAALSGSTLGATNAFSMTMQNSNRNYWSDGTNIYCDGIAGL